MSQGIFKEGKGTGYMDGSRICMIRCFSCGKENFALAVADGVCAVCGYNPNALKEKAEPEEGSQ